MSDLICMMLVFLVGLIGMFASPIGRLLGVMDYPDGQRKMHARPTPLVGGLALMLPMTSVALLQAARQADTAWFFVTLVLAGAGSVLLGFANDRRQIAPAWRLTVSTTLFGLALLVGAPDLMITRLDFELGGAWLTVPLGVVAVPFTLLCLVGLQNAINMADGSNGLVLCLSIYWACALLLYSPPSLVPYLMLFLVGAIVLLPFNLAGRLFLGDAGSYSIGAVMGLLMIYVYVRSGGRLPLTTVILWLSLPVLDCLRLIAARILSGRSPFLPDNDHFHHRLSLDRPWPYAVAVYVGIAAAPGLAAAIWPEHSLVLLVLTFVLYVELLRRAGHGDRVRAASGGKRYALPVDGPRRLTRWRRPALLTPDRGSAASESGRETEIAPNGRTGVAEAPVEVVGPEPCRSDVSVWRGRRRSGLMSGRPPVVDGRRNAG